jgi:hypothetical protein
VPIFCKDILLKKKMHSLEKYVEVEVKVKVKNNQPSTSTSTLTFLSTAFLQNYLYLCTPIKRRVQNDKDNFS